MTTYDGWKVHNFGDEVDDPTIFGMPGLDELCGGSVADGVADGKVPLTCGVADVAVVAATPAIDGAATLDLVRHTLGRYVVFPSPEAADAVTLYAAATWAAPWLDIAPRLVVQSPERRCGKTRLIGDVLPDLVRSPLKTISISPAALVRSVSEAEPRTIIMDETDTVFTKGSDEKNEMLRGILNSGFGRGMPYIRWDAQNACTEECDTYSFAILSGINNGKMPDTVLDRAIIIPLQRKAPGESVERYRARNDRAAIQAAGAELGAWVESVGRVIGDARPELPAELNDRAQDLWEPLLALADEAGGTWPLRARRAALLLSGAAEDDADDLDSRRLLADLRDIFSQRYWMDAISTADLLTHLNAIDDAPWREWYGRPMTSRDLSNLLRPYNVRPKTTRPDPANPSSTPKGYKKSDLQPLWDRYLPPPRGVSATPATTATPQVSTAFDDATDPPQKRHNNSLGGFPAAA